MRALNTAATGMKAMELAIEVIANNISNSQTIGFKSQSIVFSDLLYQKDLRAGIISDQAGNIIPSGIEIGLGVKAAGVYRINEQGQPIKTDSQYDLAIRGNGYFRIEMPDGTFAYTRAGSFRLSPNSEIVTDKGMVLSPGIIIPPNVISNGVKINSNGEVSAFIQGNPNPQIVGQIILTDFLNPSGLDSIGDNLFLETVASGNSIVSTPNIDGMGDILQGWLEQSNVDPVKDITGIISAQRVYELCSKIITTADNMLEVINRITK